MLREVMPDICVITTHPQHHAEMVAICAARPATRAIICEKPIMALSTEECDSMIDACQRAGVLLQVNHNRRWHPEWNLAKHLLNEGDRSAQSYLLLHGWGQTRTLVDQRI